MVVEFAVVIAPLYENYEMDVVRALTALARMTTLQVERQSIQALSILLDGRECMWFQYLFICLFLLETVTLILFI